jgi:GTP-binding protein Era
MNDYRAGYVGVFGRTNVGKSTFINAVLGRKLLMTSPKPQATRNRIECVLTTDTAQIVFVDTPGLHTPHNSLGRHLVREARRGARGIDVMLYMVEPWGHVHPGDRKALDSWQLDGVPFILLVNKIDTAKGNALEETLLAYDALDRFAELVPISATRGIGLDEAVSTIVQYLPKRSPLFTSDQPWGPEEEFLISELIREQVFQQTRQEVPYATAVRVKWLREPRPGLVEIRAEIIVARESQRGILIGKGGRTIKAIGSAARTDIESALGRRAFLDLSVRTETRWNEDEGQIERMTRIG